MNRRQLFYFAAVAPVALPMVAEAMATESYIYIGVDWAAEMDRLGVAYLRDTMEGWEVGYARITCDNLITASRHPDFFKLETLLSEHDSSVIASKNKPLLNQT